jgi:DNA polymerase III alpha subunit (gram-positive type)
MCPNESVIWDVHPLIPIYRCEKCSVAWPQVYYLADMEMCYAPEGKKLTWKKNCPDCEGKAVLTTVRHINILREREKISKG